MAQPVTYIRGRPPLDGLQFIANRDFWHLQRYGYVTMPDLVAVSASDLVWEMRGSKAFPIGYASSEQKVNELRDERKRKKEWGELVRIDDLCTLPVVARRTGRHWSTCKEWWKKGGLEPIGKIGSSYIWLWQHVVEYLNSRNLPVYRPNLTQLNAAPLGERRARRLASGQS